MFSNTYLSQEPMPIEQLVQSICDQKQGYTQFGGLRPFGVSFLFAGWDKHHGFQLYQSDPSGNYGGWKAAAIGANHGAATSMLKQEYKEDETEAGAAGGPSTSSAPSRASSGAGVMDLEAAQKLALKVLSKTMDSTTLSSEKLELAILSRDEASGKVR